MINVVIEGIVELLFELVFEVFLFYSGEIITYIFSLGSIKPRWDFFTDEEPAKFVVLSDFSVIIGMVFWGILILIISN